MVSFTLCKKIEGMEKDTVLLQVSDMISRSIVNLCSCRSVCNAHADRGGRKESIPRDGVVFMEAVVILCSFHFVYVAHIFLRE